MGRDRCEQIITRRLDVFWCAQHVMSTQRMKKQALTEDTVMMHWRLRRKLCRQKSNTVLKFF